MFRLSKFHCSVFTVNRMKAALPTMIAISLAIFALASRVASAQGLPGGQSYNYFTAGSYQAGTTVFNNAFLNGQEAWAYSSGVTSLIGLYGGTHVAFSAVTGAAAIEDSQPTGLLPSGQVTGLSYNYGNLAGGGVYQTGQDAWVAVPNGTGYQTYQIGLYGGQHTIHDGNGNSINDCQTSYVNTAGQVAGLSYNYGNLAGGGTYQTGQDAWVAVPNGTGYQTYQIGLYGGQHTIHDGNGNSINDCQATYVNTAGQVIGLSYNYGNLAGGGVYQTGQDAWVAVPNGTGYQTYQIGLYNGQYLAFDVNGNPINDCQANFLTNSGAAYGYSENFTTNNYDPWIYVNGVTYPVSNMSNANLSGADLIEAPLGSALLTNANLTGTYLYSSTLSNANLTGANLTNAYLYGSTLTGANLSGATVAGADFGSTGLASSQLYSTLSYSQSNLQGIGLEGNDLTAWNLAGQNLTNANFVSATLSNANLTNANLTNANLYSATLSSANLTSANLAGASLVSATLSNANFTDANLTNANLYGSTLTGANFSGATVAGAIFGSTGLTSSQLYSTLSYSQSNLQGIHLKYDVLTGWNFAGQNLAGAYLYSATLSNANLAGANLSGSTLTGATFAGAAVTGADFGYTTANGFNSSQLYSTLSYSQSNLQGIGLEGNDLTGWNLAGQNLSGANFSSGTLTNTNLANSDLTNADFTGATLSGGTLSGADLRGAIYSSLSGAATTNAILSSGTIAGLNLNAANPLLVVRDYSGVPSIPIRVTGRMTVASGGTLQMLLDGPTWRSTISFAAGIPVTLGGNLELDTAPRTSPSSLVGLYMHLFDWSGVIPSGQFQVINGVGGSYHWDTSGLYSSGNVMLLAGTGTLAAWVSNSNGAWSAPANWSATVPNGIDSVATLGNVAAAESLNVTLDTNVTLGTVILNSSNGYTLGGTGTLIMRTTVNNPAIYAANGNDVVEVSALSLAGPLNVTVSSGSLTINSDIGESAAGMGLTMAGPGTLILCGSNSFTGGAYVESGTTILTNNEGLADGSNLTVGDASLFALVVPNLAANGITPSSVPEPSTRALFTAAIFIAAVCHRLRSRTSTLLFP
jgi:autotransporter-associated beta strand protein